MGYIAVTYTFANSTLADATQVNANFQNIIDGLSDATKNLNISALTAGGAASLGAAVTLGTTSVNDITINGSLASSVAIKTTYSYDIGAATIGLKSIYLGSSDSAARSTRVIGATVASSWTLTLPIAAGSAGDAFVNVGSGVSSWVQLSETTNVGLTASVGSNQLTVTFKTGAGADPTAAAPSYITFRSATSTTGTPVRRAITAAVAAVVVPNTATLGHISAVDQYIWIYACDNAGTVEIALSGVTLFDDSIVASTTAVSAGATSPGVLYTRTGVTLSNVPIKLIGRITVQEATAGTWATAPTVICVNPTPFPAMSDWTSYTPTMGAGFGTCTNVSFKWKREGSDLLVKGTYTTGTTANAVYSITLPNSLIIDTTKMTLANTTANPGPEIGYWSQQGGSHSGPIVTATSTSTSLVYLGCQDVNVTMLTPAAATTAGIGASSVTSSYFRIPISGWSTFGP